MDSARTILCALFIPVMLRIKPACTPLSMKLSIPGYGYSGDGGPAALGNIARPYALAFDSKHNLYIADTGNDRIRMIVPGDAGPAFSVSATQLHLSALLDGSAATQTLTINNSGGGFMSWTGATSAPWLTLSSTSGFLPGAASITVRASPAGLSAGNYTGTITLTSPSTASPTTVAVQLTIPQAKQTITFTQPISPVRYGVAPITLSASATSGLPVTFTVTGPATLNGTSLKITGVGTVVIRANQAGNSDYAAATTVTKEIVVDKASLTVHAKNTTVAYNQPIPTLTYTLTGFVNGDTAAVVSGAPVETSTATKGSAIGNYSIKITAGTLSAANYGGWATVNFILTITK